MSSFPPVDDLLTLTPGASKKTDLGWIHGTYHRDPRMTRNHPRVMVRVDVMPRVQEVAGYSCQHGINFFICYKDEVPAVQKLVPTEKERTMWSLAEEAFQARLLTEAEAKGINRAVYEHEKEEIRREVARTSKGSISEEYYRMTGMRTHGLPPVVSMELGPDVDPPETPASFVQKQQQSLVDGFAAAFQKALSNVQAPAPTPKGKSAA